METMHTDAAAVDRLGRGRIMSHFNISRQAIDYWRKHGVPKRHRKTLAMLGVLNGVPMKEMEEVQ